MAWREFSKGKKDKRDVLNFSLNLEDNIFELQDQLLKNEWRAEEYVSFMINDPKLRKIHKASVRDRVLYHAVYRIIYSIFDETFIFDSYSSRVGKGTHAGVERLGTFARKLSQNYKKTIYALKCDVRKFFDSIDHEILKELLREQINDVDTNNLLEKIISSFHKEKGKGLPLGNVTSQVFANVYMNQLDWFIKKELKMKYYLRYCDDFVILSENKEELFVLLSKIQKFLKEKLLLELHPNKIEIRKFKQGIDFLGYVILSHYSVLRTKTKNRMFRKLKILNKKDDSTRFKRSEASYFGLLTHCRSNKIRQKLGQMFR